MKSPISSLVAVVLATGVAAAGDLGDNAFFQALEGTWRGEGSLTNAEGETQDLKNEIEAGFADDGGTFTIEGSLLIGDSDESESLDYRWLFTEHSLEGLYLGRFIDLTNDQEREFEVSINEAARSAKLTETSGSSAGNRIELTKQFEGENYVVDIAFIDSSGNKTLEGHLEFEPVAP
ncbi:MAG: hypothetical protein WD342_18425 [Verrucomicrobiales bacterium]